MSEYQKLKARAQEAQQAREREIKREIEAKAEKEKQKRREEEERRKRQEAESRAARTLELKRANEAINKGKEAASGFEYDPFAEEERRPTPAAPANTKAKLATNKQPGNQASPLRQAKFGQDIPRPPSRFSGNGDSKPKPKKAVKETTPPALGRKEQAARAMMASAKRSAGSSSIFSVRPTGASSPAPAPASGPVKMKQTTLGKQNTRRKQQASQGELRALCPDRTSRDQRTIDEIQRDIKARKAGPSQSRSPLPEARPRDRIAPPSSSTKDGKIVAKHPPRRRSPSTSSSSSSSSSDVRGPTRKRPRPAEHGGSGNKSEISSMIQDIFRRPGRPALTSYDSDSDGSDMEAGFSDVEEEERRAIRLAKREDEIAEKEERERKERKERLKRERERGVGR